MIVNIFEKESNIEKVINDIVRRSIYPNKPKYIIMSTNTFSKLKPSKNIQLFIDNYYSEDTKYSFKEDVYAIICNTPIAICDKLKDGEVEIV